ncbi:hypothetical protein D9M72_343490 [compost metagenome]
MGNGVGHECSDRFNHRGWLDARGWLNARGWLGYRRSGGFQPRGHFRGRQRTEQPEQIRDTFHAAHPAVRGEALQLPFDGFNDLGVQKLAQLHPSQELIEQG